MPPRYDAAQLPALHRRLCLGDRTASDETISLLLSPLVQNLAPKFPHIDDHTIRDGVIDALLEYCTRPNRFDEGRGIPLDRFLQHASWRNVVNALRAEARRKAREERAEHAYTRSAVELDPAAGNLLQEEVARRQREQGELLRLLQNPKDQQILALQLQGERRTEAFAEILGISHLPMEAQRREVKRAKDRIDKILRRRGTRS